MNLDAYLSRIGVPARPAADLAGLVALHRAHLHQIPYENLDVQLGRPVTRDRVAIFDKLVTQRRGGWCYEMNGLFGWALEELGFRVTRATGSVMRVVRGVASDGNHLVLRVDLDEGIYLADVGFGDGAIAPIPIRPGAFEANGFAFSVSRVDADWWRFHNHPAGSAPSFDFNLDVADEAMLDRQCRWLQSSDESPFVQNVVCQRHVPNGLIILRGRVLRRIAPGGVSERLIADSGEFVDDLRAQFDLDVPDSAQLWPSIVARHEVLFGQANRSPE